MALDDLPNGFFVPTRDEIRDQYQNDVKLRIPGAPIGEGSQAFAEGSVIADVLAPSYSNAISLARDADLDDKTFEGLKTEARGMGIPELLPASAGAGWVEISASAGGVPIDEGRELYDEKTSLKFKCAATGVYFDKKPVPVIGIDVGPTTNLPAGTVLKWRNPPPGLGPAAKILPDSNGDGLTGGRNDETAGELKDRIKSERAEPAAGGNIAHVRRAVKLAGKHLGIAIQECFVYSCIQGPGTYAYVFTLRPAKPGASRAPNAVQIAQVVAFITAVFPEDDGILPCILLEQGLTCKLKVDWSPGAGGWVDAMPWPRAEDDFEVESVVDATQFNVKSVAVGPAEPQVGQTIAFYNAATSKFVRKRIGSVTNNGSGSFTLVCDTTNNASDATYVPSVGEELCPWSDSLDGLVEPMALEFDDLGPGEQTGPFFDAGLREKRVPLNPASWPSTIRHKMVDGVDDRPEIGDVQWLAPSVPYVTPIGTKGVSSNLLTLARLLVFPP